jgi:hypothetical protein
MTVPPEHPKGKRPLSEARISGMVATVALLVMFTVAGVFLWIGS